MKKGLQVVSVGEGGDRKLLFFRGCLENVVLTVSDQTNRGDFFGPDSELRHTQVNICWQQDEESQMFKTSIISVEQGEQECSISGNLGIKRLFFCVREQRKRFVTCLSSILFYLIVKV